MRTTSTEIKTLKKNEIIVFGSNKNGNHAGGLAKLCKDKFKAKEGIARGFTGQCYAIDTMSGFEVIREQIQPFIESAKIKKDKTFLVTKIGCGIASYSENDIAPLFNIAKNINNIYLPIEFWEIINKIN